MNPWVEHVRAYAKAHKTTYACALSNRNIKKGYIKVKDRR